MTPPNRRSDPHLDVTLEQLARMHRALAHLHDERARYGDAWFAVMAEGPLDEIARLEAELDRLSGRRDAERDRADLWMYVRGPGLRWPNAPTSVVTSFLDTLRKGVQVVAELLSTRDVSRRPTRALKDSCDFEVLGFASGSVGVGVALPDSPLLPLHDGPSPAEHALHLYLSVSAWAADPDGTEEELQEWIKDQRLRRLLLAEVKRLLPRPRGRVESVALSGRAVPGGHEVVLDRSAHARIDAVMAAQPDVHLETYEGDLREIDLDQRSFILRNIRDQSASFQVACKFLEDLDETAYEAIDRRIEVDVVRPIEARRGTATPTVVRLEILDAEAE